MPTTLLLLALLQTAEPHAGPVGIVVDVGPEVVVPHDGSKVTAGFRLGAGVRVGLLPPPERVTDAMPSLALVAGYVNDGFSAGFLETRLELGVVARAQLIQPALVTYVIAGGTFTRAGSSPYFGLGFGWNPTLFEPQSERSMSGSSFDFRGMGWVGLVFAFFVMGRVEVRVHPTNVPMTTVLIGLGF